MMKTIEPYEKCSFLRKTWRDLKLTFSIPKIPGPLEMRRRAKKDMKKALASSADGQIEIEIDGKKYVVMPEDTHRRSQYLAHSRMS